jgi:hypothetical protein
MNFPCDRLQLVLHPWKDVNLRVQDWESMTGEEAIPCMVNSNAQATTHLLGHCHVEAPNLWTLILHEQFPTDRQAPLVTLTLSNKLRVHNFLPSPSLNSNNDALNEYYLLWE